MGANSNMSRPQLLIALGFRSAMRTLPDAVAEVMKSRKRGVLATTAVARPRSLGGIGLSGISSGVGLPHGGFELLDVLAKPRVQLLRHIERHRDANFDLPNHALLALP